MGECIDDAEVAKALLDAAGDWLRQQGMDLARGPIDLATHKNCHRQELGRFGSLGARGRREPRLIRDRSLRGRSSAPCRFRRPPSRVLRRRLKFL